MKPSRHKKTISNSPTGSKSKAGNQGRKHTQRSRTENASDKRRPQTSKISKSNTAIDRPPTSPDLFVDGKATSMASAFPIWEASNILTQRNHLAWQADPDGKLCYARQVGNGKGAIHFWVTEDIEDEHPASLAGAAALAVIDAFDIRAACMHLLYAAHAAHLERPWEQELVIDDRQIEDFLGLKKRTDKNRREKLALIEEIAKQPCKITTFISWPTSGKVKKFTVQEGRLWHILATNYHFQYDLFGNKELAGITFIVRPGMWTRHFLNEEGRRENTAFYQSGPLSRALLEDVMSVWQHREGAARLMVWLLFKTQLDRQAPLNVHTLMEVAYGSQKVQEAKQSSEHRKKLANHWDADLLTLHDRGWKLAFDPHTYPPEIQPPGFGRGAKLRPRGFFDQLLKGHLWITPQDDLRRDLVIWTDKPEPPQPAIEILTQPSLTGTQVRTLRKSRGWSQLRLHAITGIAQGLISMIENEERPISPENDTCLRKVFELDN